MNLQQFVHYDGQYVNSSYGDTFSASARQHSVYTVGLWFPFSMLLIWDLLIPDNSESFLIDNFLSTRNTYKL